MHKKMSLEPDNSKTVPFCIRFLLQCTEHVFEAVIGVESRYLDILGRCKESSYELVGSNRTGHAEAVAVL
jgi:peptide-methionine (S)-S-oxide reductase